MSGEIEAVYGVMPRTTSDGGQASYEWNLLGEMTHNGSRTRRAVRACTADALGWAIGAAEVDVVELDGTVLPNCDAGLCAALV